jgi:hypothetical protein
VQPLGDRQRHRGEGPDRHQQHVLRQPVGGDRQHVDAVTAFDGGDVLPDVALREADRGGTVLDVEGFAQLLA